jgi:hypothetical protein
MRKLRGVGIVANDRNWSRPQGKMSFCLLIFPPSCVKFISFSPFWPPVAQAVVYLGWPIATSYMSPKAGGGGGVAGFSPWVQNTTDVHRSPNKHWRFNPILNPCSSRIIVICLPAIGRGLERLNVYGTYPLLFYFYAYCTIILADLQTMWGDVVFSYQTTPYSQSAGVHNYRTQRSQIK